MDLQSLVTATAQADRRGVLKLLPAAALAAALPAPMPAAAQEVLNQPGVVGGGSLGPRPLDRGEAIGVKPVHSAEDYWAIRQVLARHARLFDEGRLAEAHALAPIAGGPENILLPGGGPGTQTLITNPLVTPESPGTAWVESYFCVLQATPSLPLQPIVAGYHHDRFVRQDGAWRIAVRRTEVRLTGELRQHLKDPARVASQPQSDRLPGDFADGPRPKDSAGGPLPASPLTPLDHFAIESVLSDQCYWADLGRWTEAGRHLKASKREQANIILHEDGTPRTSTLLSNFLITPDDSGGATVETSYAVFQATPTLHLQPILAGTYRDRFVRAGISWRISSRQNQVRLVGNVSQHLKQPPKI